MAQRTETYVCQGCTATVTRQVARGQRPKWCDECRRGSRVKRITCEHCGVECMTWRAGRFCSRECSSAAQVKPRETESRATPVDRRGPLRKAIESNDDVGVIEAIRSMCDTSTECWIWQRKLSRGYATVVIADRFHQVHRLVLSAKHGSPLGSQVAHHMCANTSCVNPDHLQPVTHRDNLAEMHARKSYLLRIAELEAALADAAPNHPLLHVIAVA